MNILNKEVLSFADVALVPLHSTIKHREEVSLNSELSLDLKFKLPLITSPMSSISKHQMMIAMAKLGGLAVLHRTKNIGEQCEEIEKFIKIYPEYPIAIAVGVSEGQVEKAVTLIKEYYVDIINFDVAHGDHVLMERAIKMLKDCYPDIHIMAGNVATGESFYRLSKWGADSIRVGISPGSICQTAVKTAHGLPILFSVMDCYEVKKKYNLKTKIIADGGHKNCSDIIKSLACGADFVMVGEFVAGTNETPGIIEYDNTGYYKSYFGSASKKGQQDMKGSIYSIEGVEAKVPYRGSVVPILQEAIQNIKSGLTYSGARNIKELQEVAIFAKITTNGYVEGTPHILNRK